MMMDFGWIDNVDASFQENKNRHERWYMYNEQLDRQNDAVQRRVKDLVAAGLNPMLAFMGGGSGIGSAGTPPPVGGNSRGGHYQPSLLNSAQVKLTEAQANQLNTSSALQAAETKKIIDTLPELIKSMRGEAARKDFGRDTLERSEDNMKKFWQFLERLGGNLGSSAYDYMNKSVKPDDVMHGENRPQGTDLSPEAKAWRAKRRQEIEKHGPFGR